MTVNTLSAPRSIIIVGGGTVAALAAIALRRALPQAKVTLVEVPVPPGALADQFPLLRPSARALVENLGIDDALLRGHGVALPVLGSSFEGVGPSPFAIVYDDLPVFRGVPLHLLALAHGRGGILPAISSASALIAAGRYTEEIDHALRLSPAALAPLLAALMQRHGVERITPGRIVANGRDGMLLGIGLDDGGTLSADFYVDASGPRRLLSLGDTERWDDVAPTRSMRHRAVAGAPASVDQYRAHDGGWRAVWARSDGVDHLLVEAAASPDIDEHSNTIVLEPGRLLRPMVGNVVAIGEAAVDTGPMLSLGLTLACRGIELLLDLLPAATPETALADEYNRRMALVASHARNLLAVLNRRGRIEDGRPIACLDRFRRNGRLPRRDDDLIADAEWVTMLIGLGIQPHQRDALAHSISHADAIAALNERSQALAALQGRSSTCEQWLAQRKAHQR